MLRRLIAGIFQSAHSPNPRPVLTDRLESNVPGLYVVGDLAGASVLNLAMDQGARVANYLSSEPRSSDPAILDAIVVGTGAAGLNAALALHGTGRRVVVFERSGFASTVAELPEGKWIYAEPADHEAAGPLWLGECSKEDLVARWAHQVEQAGLAVRTQEPVTDIRRTGDGFTVTTSLGQYRARRIVLAIGKAGASRRLGVEGEDQSWVRHRLYQTSDYRNEQIVVAGGGNSAAEAATALAADNRVTLVHRGPELYRLSRPNRRALDAAVRGGSVELALNARIVRFTAAGCLLDTGREVPCQHAFVLIGSEAPVAFLRGIGVRLESDWPGRPLRALLPAAVIIGAFAAYGPSAFAIWAALAAMAVLLVLSLRGDRYALLAFTSLLCYAIFGIKQAPGQEFWPFTNWGANAASFMQRPWSFWYTVLYTAVMTVFGIQALKRWGIDRNDSFQIWRYTSLLGFQWIFFFIVPEFLFRWAVEYEWLGAELSRDPNFAANAWRSYGIVYAWPLFFYTFFGSPHQVWIVWGALLSFAIIPTLVLFHGKRYCSWICGCGGLAETLGDRWRHLAPKGEASIRWERMNSVVLAAAVAITLLMLSKDAIALARKPADIAIAWYRLIIDTWLVGIVPVALYPFFGGKIWCRYWCPLAKMMEVFSKLFTRFSVSRFSIHSNDRCIACGDCSRNCQVGIDVMRYALRQEPITNANTSCIGCGICVTVCPMDVLSFARPSAGNGLVQIDKAAGPALS